MLSLNVDMEIPYGIHGPGFSSKKGFIHKTNVLLRGANKNVKMQINFLMKLQ